MNDSADRLERLCWEIRRTFRDLAAAADVELEPLGIHVGDRALLEFLAHEPAPVSLSDLARKRSVSRQHIHQALKRLPDPSWIDRLQNPVDLRTLMLRLSPKGRAFFRRVRARDAAFFERLAPRVPRAEVESATRLLRQLRRELGANPGREGAPDA
ncbi:MAG: MarR family winged helix-turn-helix transcriptional regulator [Thermoanaerobaculia bacterium]